MFKFNPILACDAYKLSHKNMYPEGTELVYSNFTPRSNKHFSAPVKWKGDFAVVAGITGLVAEMVDAFQEGFFSQPLVNVLAEYRNEAAPFCGLSPEEVEVDHLIKLHELGYLPLVIKALPEGTLCPMQVPMLTVRNTHGKEFSWVTNYLETWLSTEGWKPCTSATTAYILRKVLDHYAEETGGDKSFVDWQGHDFSMRGMSGVHDAARTGMGHLLSFLGSDTIPAAKYLKQYYSAEGPVGFSVPASEHSVATMGGIKGEFEILDRILFDVHPSGIVSVVADSYDFFKVVTEYVSSRKERIIGRTVNSLGMAKSVFRPDSGSPEDILCGQSYLADFIIEEGQSVPVSMISKTTRFPEWSIKDRDWAVRSSDGQYWGSEFMDGEFRFIKITPTPEMKGAVECLWDVFGGTTTEKGYKVLHERVGLIYGDSITIECAEEICQRLMAKGFASTNCVFGIGSFSMQLVSRDSLGFAMKATYGVVNGVGREIFKQPKTDSGKNSAKGLLRVELENGKLVLHDQQTWEQEHAGELKLVFADGIFNQAWIKENTLVKIRARLGAS